MSNRIRADRDDLSRRGFLGVVAGTAAASLVRGQDSAPLPPVRAITEGPKFHWRGYYDKLLFDPTNRYVLANEVSFEGRSPTPDDSIRVGMIDTLDGDTWTEIGETFAWNWQQGCMLQWVPGSAREVAWNDRQDGRFVTCVARREDREERTLPHPFYCLSPDGRWAFTTDFRRLNDTRPGYGYGGIPDPNRSLLAPENSGIWRMDMRTGNRELIVSLADAANVPFTGKADAAFDGTSKHWFNHLLCNTDGSRLFFLHRWQTPGKGGFKTRAFTVKPDGCERYVLDPYGDTSHFVWRDPVTSSPGPGTRLTETSSTCTRTRPTMSRSSAKTR